MTDTERITNAVFERHLDGFRFCRTANCFSLVAGQEFCPRCQEELDGEPYPLANILHDGLAPIRLRHLAAALAGGMVAVAIWLTWRVL